MLSEERIRSSCDLLIRSLVLHILSYTALSGKGALISQISASVEIRSSSNTVAYRLHCRQRKA
jgi:hypothetical protein